MNKKPEWFKGIFPALVTPFADGRAIDEAAYRSLIRFVLPHVNGVVPVGTTGEFVYLTEEEKRRAIAIALDEVAGRVPVVAGTGCASTRDTVALTRYAKDAGAQAALVVAPYYLKPAYNEIYEHYEAVSKVGLPIILYNIPQCAGTHYEWWTAEGLAHLDNVVGIKDSSGDMPFLMALFEKIKGLVGIFCGHDEIITAALAAGADGAILASANLIPDVWQQIYAAVRNGDLAQAQALQAKIQILVRLITRQGSVQAVKEGLQMMGLPVGNARLPMMPGDAFRREDREDLRWQLEKLGKIPLRAIEYELCGKTVRTTVPATPQTPRRVSGFALKIGEGFAGPPFFELAHIDLLLGERGGPVDKAIAQALTVPHPGHEVRLVYERPRTLLVPTVTLRTDKQAEHVYTWATNGVVQAIEASITDGFLPREALDDLVMIANVFVHPAAANRRRIEVNNYKAMRAAIRKAIEGRPTLEELLYEKQAARHPFRYAP
ncbi:MAG: 4-hydroxy-tetrahydrodipicolinate synthase [Chloroflexi bacterium]|nr:4-hydroxy-tetrahydrodipicolinate synthase [Chloroflexota bacterium]